MTEIKADHPVVSDLSSNIGNPSKENMIYRSKKEEEITKAKMLEECIEQEETTLKIEVKEIESANDSNHQNGESHDVQQQKLESIAEQLHEFRLTSEERSPDKACQQKKIPSYQRLTHSQSLKSGTSLLGKSGNASSPTRNSNLPKNLVSKTKSAVQSSKDKILTLTKKGNKAQVENVEVTSTASKSPVLKQTSLVPIRQNYTVPRPFSLATDRRASLGLQHGGNEGAQNESKYTSNVTPPMAEKKQITAKSASGVLETKLPHPIAQKSRALNEALKGKTSVAAAGSVTTSNEGGKKWKELKSKLGVKLRAKEEKSQLQTKTKEQQEDRLKKTKKSFSLKESPMPDLHHEAAAPKLELKKKLGKRNNSAALEHEDNPLQCKKTTHSVEASQGDKMTKTPCKGNSAVTKTKISATIKTTQTSTKRKSFSKEPVTPKQEDLPEDGSVITIMILNGSETSINEEKMRLQGGDGVEQEIEIESLDRQSMTLESNTGTDLITKQENLIGIAETAAIAKNMHILVGSN